MSQNDCNDLPAHLAAHQVQVPKPGAKPMVQELHEELAGNVSGPRSTMPTGYISHCDVVEPDVFGSGSEWYGDHWDSGFAGPGDPYGIGEYTAQSANPNAVPTQAQADEIVAKAQAERKAPSEGHAAGWVAS